MSTVDTSTRIPFPQPAGYTLADFMVRVAREWGLANESGGTSKYPVDDEAVDQVLDAVNLGFRRFMSGYDKWTWMRPHVTVRLNATGDGPMNIDGDPSRYRLPPGVEGGPIEDWTFVDDLSDYTRIQQVPYDVIRGHYSLSPDQAGTPYLAATAPLREYGPVNQATDLDRTAWQLIVYPKPDESHVIEAKFLVTPQDMADPDERHIAGAIHDRAVLAAARLEMAMMDTVRSDNRTAMYRDDFDRALAESIRHDQQNVTHRLGMMRDTSGVLTRDDWREATYDGRVIVQGIDPNA